MSQPPTRPGPDDLLLQRYHEANALDDARPSPELRERVLAHARVQAEQHAQQPAPVRPAAANDSAWKLRALGSLAVLGLVGLLALQFDRGTPEEREVAFGSAPSPSVPAARPPSVVTPDSPAAPPADPAPPAASIAPPPAPRALVPAPKPEAALATPATKATDRPAAGPAAPPTTATERHAAEAAPDPFPASAAPTPAPELAARPAPAPAAAPASESTAAPAVAARQRAPMPSTGKNAADTAAITRQEGVEAPAPPADAAGRSAQPRPTARLAVKGAPLLAATARGDAEAVRALLVQGVGVNSRDDSGRSALMLAAQRGDVALVRLLLGAGADPQVRNPQGQTAADLARAAGHSAVLELLEPAQPR